jgi:hypothetical protein
VNSYGPLRGALGTLKRILRYIGKQLCRPSDWLITKTDARARRAIGFWTIICSAIGAIFWGRTLLFLTIISILALVPNYLSETPVEKEEA